MCTAIVCFPGCDAMTQSYLSNQAVFLNGQKVMKKI